MKNILLILLAVSLGCSATQTTNAPPEPVTQSAPSLQLEVSDFQFDKAGDLTADIALINNLGAPVKITKIDFCRTNYEYSHRRTMGGSTFKFNDDISAASPVELLRSGENALRKRLKVFRKEQIWYLGPSDTLTIKFTLPVTYTSDNQVEVTSTTLTTTAVLTKKILEEAAKFSK